MSTHPDRTAAPLIVAIGKQMEDACRANGMRHVVDASLPHALIDRNDAIRPEVEFFDDYVILIPEGGESVRDTIAIKLGDERCRWAYYPEDPRDIPTAVATARPM
jgi:hypothetical protein